MIPWLAMQLDVDGVVWSTGDYVAATALLTLLWGLIEAVLHLALQGAARMLAFACAVLVVAGIWAGLAVG